MKQKSFEVEFLTPAFLGDAEQSGRWRTPPFKAQLRQFWRVAYMHRNKFRFDLATMRQEEGKLFGNAWLQNDFQKSLVRMRLSHWGEGTLKAASWTSLDKVHHPEAEKSGHQVAADLYLGYGPVTLEKGAKKPSLKASAAIQAGERAQLALAYPEVHASDIEHALSLMHLYGTVGSRSRNSWGSFSCVSNDEQPSAFDTPLLDWVSCLATDWPHAIGCDEIGPLVWITEPQRDWRQVLVQLAQIKIKLRTQFTFPNEKPDSQVHDRHWLSYPITRHDVGAWKRFNGRLPNSLRFKVRMAASGQLIGVIFHMPHLPPAAFRPDRTAIKDVWRKVHVLLDAIPELTRTQA